jgi:2-phospho-L-lactate transferase/gluconeogenesis factor (CofD/UPF0052 family)
VSRADTDLAAFSAQFDLGPMPEGPRVVALGGGHGLATALRAARLYAGSITAIVSVADDGGSSGRLRRYLDVLAPGDLRKALAALAEEGSTWPRVLEHRFNSGDLEGHTVGNILLVGLGRRSEVGRPLWPKQAASWALPVTCCPRRSIRW